MILRRKQDDSASAAITRLADGSAGDVERAQLEAAVAGSPELAAELAEQRRAVSLLAGVYVEAPPALHERVGAIETRPERRRSRGTIRVGVIALATVVVVLVALARPAGHASVHGVIAVALASAEQPAPGLNPRDQTVLGIAIDRTTFPNWGYRGWRTSGSRLDTLGGQAVETVYYTAPGGVRIGYSIVGGTALPVTAARLALNRDGVSYDVISQRGARVVTWRRDGHTCVLASRQAPVSALLALAQAD